jgi:hypothetical protein
MAMQVTLTVSLPAPADVHTGAENGLPAKKKKITEMEVSELEVNPATKTKANKERSDLRRFPAVCVAVTQCQF